MQYNIPLLSLIAPFVKKTFRPDPDKSVVEDIYSSEENPSPLLGLLDELYARHAIGIIKFWIGDEKEATTMKETLEVGSVHEDSILTGIFFLIFDGCLIIILLCSGPLRVNLSTVYNIH